MESWERSVDKSRVAEREKAIEHKTADRGEGRKQAGVEIAVAEAKGVYAGKELCEGGVDIREERPHGEAALYVEGLDDRMEIRCGAHLLE
jgi:hypothetical protein